MGNSACSCKCCRLLCSEEKDTVINKQMFISITEYACNSLSDQKLKVGDLLEVTEEGQHWVYAKRFTVKGAKKGFIEEQLYVPRDFLKPVGSLEAQS